MTSIIKTDIENQTSNYGKIACTGLTVTFIMLILMGPIAICDLYYSQNDNTCIDEYSQAANVNMQTYLLVSGIIEVVLIASVGVLTMCYVAVEEKKDDAEIVLCCGVTPIVIACMFIFAWDIVGAVVFWGHVYELGNCSQTTSTYIFASLIIKFVGVTSVASTSSQSKK
jgi:hypothetical protein